jgi:hypothetical protein
MTAQSHLRVKNHGSGTVYLSLPLACFANEREAIEDLLRNSRRRPHEAPGFLLLTGQADFAARVVVNDFRTILELGFPREIASTAFVYNWVFSSIYDEEDASVAIDTRIPIRGAGKSVPPAMVLPLTIGVPADEPPLRFIVHLRVMRSFYGSQPLEAESALVAGIRRLFGDIRISVETGIGWSDLIVSGNIRADQFSEASEKLIGLNTYTAGSDPGNSVPLFTRTLTLFGYEPDSDPRRMPRISDGEAEALIFVRSRAGKLREAQRLLETSFSGITVHVVEGKLDLVGHIQALTSDFFPSHSTIAEGVEGADCIHKLETHLLFGSLKKQRSVENTLVMPQLRLSNCECVKALGELRPAAIPPGLEHAIHNIRFLFQTSLGDSTNCCDMRPAILACDLSLNSLTARLNHANSDLSTSVTAVEERHYVTVDEEKQLERNSARVDGALEHIEEWVLMCERVLRQRTIGSFDEFLGQSDRALFYRGGAQKMLLLADCLMNDFYASAAPSVYNLPEELKIRPVLSVFATLYDAVERIKSVVGTGLVRIPARNVFKLASVIPDLWHEVGTYIFFQHLDEFRKGFDLDDRNERQLYFEMGDHFGDLIVWIYGFDCDFEQFAVSILQGWRESQPAHVPDDVRAKLLAGVALRLMFVRDVLALQHEPLTERSETWLRKEIEFLVTRHFAGVAGLKFSALTWGRAFIAWNFGPYRKHFDRLRQYVDTRHIAKRLALGKEAVHEYSNALVAFGPDEDLNAVFRRLYWSIQTTRPENNGRAENAFGPMAAVGRSAVIEYHRRLGADVRPTTELFDSPGEEAHFGV